eukprot:2675637-Amphidinium_carterae.1
MRGTLPEEGMRGAADERDQLGLSGNHHTGSIPCVIFRRGTRLELLEISMNDFTGMLSAEAVSRMASIMHFNVAFNQLAGSFPAMWRRPKLELFVPSGNRFSGTLIEVEGAPRLDRWMADTNSFS